MEKEKYSTYHIETNGFEKVLIGMLHMIQTVPLGTKCRIILDYDPALPKTTIETFIDKSDMEQIDSRKCNIEKLQETIESIAEKYALLVEMRIDRTTDLSGQDLQDIYNGIQMLGHITVTLERFSRMKKKNNPATEPYSKTGI